MSSACPFLTLAQRKKKKKRHHQPYIDTCWDSDIQLGVGATGPDSEETAVLSFGWHPVTRMPAPNSTMINLKL